MQNKRVPVDMISMIKMTPSSNDSKIIIVGDPLVGKTSLLQQFNTKEFTENTESTVGAVFASREIDTPHGPIKLCMWDTAGQERYKSLIPMYARNACGALLVVDVSRIETYESREKWYELLVNYCPKTCKIYIIANKVDQPCVIPLADLELWANELGHPFFKTCAADYETVEPVFKKAACDIAQMNAVKQFAMEGEGVSTLQLTRTTPSEEEKKKQCC